MTAHGAEGRPAGGAAQSAASERMAALNCGYAWGMCADVDDSDAPAASTGRATLGRLLAVDVRTFEALAGRHWPGADRVLPRLSRAANHGVLWFTVAACITATRTPRSRRAAAHGVASLALASATINTFGKRSVRRPRPLLDAVPLVRQLKRQPVTTSFPSGHAASAAAFATGVALESGRWGTAVAPLAAAVALSRVYTGVHYPSDVLVGAALGVGAAFAVRGVIAVAENRPHRAGPEPEAGTAPQSSA